MISRLAVLMLALSLGIGRPSLAQVTPAPPQAPAALDGVDGGGFARVPAGGSGFVDAWSRCRTVGNGASREEVIPLSSAAEWLSWRTSPPAVDSQAVCCRPATDTLCQGASGGTVTAPVNGAGVNGYGTFGSTGTATATCSDPPYGTYQDTRTYVCGQTGSGVNADGQWSQSGGDTNTCTANSYVSYGACSTAGSGGWGNQWEQVYNSCGQLTSQGYFGPACYTPPPCTNNWQPSYGACAGTCGGNPGTQTVTMTNYGTCGGSYTTTRGCITDLCAPQYHWWQSYHSYPPGQSDAAAWVSPTCNNSDPSLFLNWGDVCKRQEPAVLCYPVGQYPSSGGFQAAGISSVSQVGTACTSQGAYGGRAIWCNDTADPQWGNCPGQASCFQTQVVCMSP